MLTCTCPAAASITEIPYVQCTESMGQIQKIAFQRLRKADGTKNGFTTSKAITKKASWTEQMAAADGSKIVVTPYIYNPTSEPGEARTQGSGNDSLGGVAEVIGSNPTNFSAAFRGIPQNVIAIVKELMCDAKSRNLGVYLFDEFGNIEAVKDPTTDGNYYPIPITALFVSDKGHGGFEAEDYNNITWSFQPNFSDNLAIVKPEDFNPVEDLIPAGE